ncbi:MAG: formate dehydrogenase accessory protein FdhE [Gemmatimonadetes bacterium]|nr:formate dehydrogenase accessory protein FdhE [Gemmatimonadota bacterium]
MENPWTVRRARAVHLLGQTPHVEEILTFYVRLTEAQESLADRVPVSDWSERIRSPEGEFPRLRVAGLPLDELALPFREFLSRVAEFGTETIKDGAQTLLSRDDDGRLEPLRAARGAWGKTEGTVENGEADEEEKGDDFYFYARAFLEPIITSIAQADSSQPTDWTQGFCFVCGGPPQVAVLRDLPDALGRRSLMCSMCATEWRFQRLTCPHCGETEADKLPVHTAESIAHVRVDACTTCSRYIKTVDLRKDGTAVPLVDELAAVELDIWAQEQGLTKLRANVLGL